MPQIKTLGNVDNIMKKKIDEYERLFRILVYPKTSPKSKLCWLQGGNKTTENKKSMISFHFYHLMNEDKRRISKYKKEDKQI